MRRLWLAPVSIMAQFVVRLAGNIKWHVASFLKLLRFLPFLFLLAWIIAPDLFNTRTKIPQPLTDGNLMLLWMCLHSPGRNVSGFRIAVFKLMRCEILQKVGAIFLPNFIRDCVISLNQFDEKHLQGMSSWLCMSKIGCHCVLMKVGNRCQKWISYMYIPKLEICVHLDSVHQSRCVGI